MVNYLNCHVVIKMFQTETFTDFFPESKSRIDELYCKKKVTVIMHLNYAGRQNFSDDRMVNFFMMIN